MQDFRRWLEAREEYDFIVDGANVAYSQQNFEGGQFSFKQVRYETFLTLTYVPKNSLFCI